MTIQPDPEPEPQSPPASRAQDRTPDEVITAVIDAAAIAAREAVEALPFAGSPAAMEYAVRRAGTDAAQSAEPAVYSPRR